MKSILTFSILAALLGGCAIVPFGYGDGHEGYRQDRGYQHGDSNYQNHDYYNRGDGNYQNHDYYNRGDGNYRDYGHRENQGNPGDPFWQRGG